MDIQQFLQRLSTTPPPLAAGELKGLEQFTEHYPWCGIAQQLLLEAIKQSGETYSGHQAAKAAIYVINRDRLHQRLQHIRVQPGPQEEEITLDLDPKKHYNPNDYFSGENIEHTGSDPVSRFLIEKPQFRPVSSALHEVEIPDNMLAPVAVTPQSLDDIVTETLAKIYEDQGLASLAMATYEKLSLLEPKKSTYFATRMQNLKFKLK